MYFYLLTGNIFLLNLDVSVVLAFLPLRLIELQQPDTWKVGLYAFSHCYFLYILAENLRAISQTCF